MQMQLLGHSNMLTLDGLQEAADGDTDIEQER